MLTESQIRVRGKGSKIRFLPLAPETVELLDHYLRLERPAITDTAVFVSLKGRARGTRMTPEGLRSLFRHHRITTGVVHANPHRFRHYAAFRTMPRVGARAPIYAHLKRGDAA
jgi:site-specific recombinase XerC